MKLTAMKMRRVWSCSVMSVLACCVFVEQTEATWETIDMSRIAALAKMVDQRTSLASSLGLLHDDTLRQQQRHHQQHQQEQHQHHQHQHHHNQQQQHQQQQQQQLQHQSQHQHQQSFLSSSKQFNDPTQTIDQHRETVSLPNKSVSHVSSVSDSIVFASETAENHLNSADKVGNTHGGSIPVSTHGSVIKIESDNLNEGQYGDNASSFANNTNERTLLAGRRIERPQERLKGPPQKVAKTKDKVLLWQRDSSPHWKGSDNTRAEPQDSLHSSTATPRISSLQFFTRDSNLHEQSTSEPEHVHYHDDVLSRRLKELRQESRKRKKHGKPSMSIEREDSWDEELRERRRLANRAVQQSVQRRKERLADPPSGHEPPLLLHLRQQAQDFVEARPREARLVNRTAKDKVLVRSSGKKQKGRN